VFRLFLSDPSHDRKATSTRRGVLRSRRARGDSPAIPQTDCGTPSTSREVSANLVEERLILCRPHDARCLIDLQQLLLAFGVPKQDAFYGPFGS
jgi:hypothetical protein